MKRPPLRSPSVVRSKLRSRVARRLAFALALGATACGQEPAPEVSSAESPIVGGSPDTTHGAVLALIDQMSATSASACTGTTIALSGASGILLTAAHCVVANDGKGHVTTPLKVATPDSLFVVPGPDWHTNVSNGLYYGVGDVVVHPQYDGAVDSPFDVAIVRFLGALPSNPVIPALSPTEDKLAVGSPITIVGFGKTLDDDMNTTRFEVDRVLQSVTDTAFTYDQSDMKGACSGDSGGPALVSTAAGLRVAGITSYGDPDCTKVGASVRVSPVFTSFIQAFLNSCLPSTLSCDECSLASVGPGNTCVTESTACATASSQCGQFLSCLDACTTQACATQCQRANPQGASDFNAIVKCQCTACSACASNTACGGTSNASTGSTMRCSLPSTSTGTAGTGGAAGTGAAGTSGGGTAIPPGSGGGGMKLQSSGGCAVAPEGALSGLAAALLALALALARSRVPARTHAQRRTRR
jgi:V8-like Glu-specific endopeptidase